MLNVPLEIEISLLVKSLALSLRLKVSMTLEPLFRALVAEVIAMVGGVTSTLKESV